MKCNPDVGVLRALKALGAGFDCASKAEAEVVQRLGVGVEDIVFANCCKRPQDMRYAAAQGISITTFDTVAELRKMKAVYREAKLLIRWTIRWGIIWGVVWRDIPWVMVWGSRRVAAIASIAVRGVEKGN